jgi:alkylhydroperoxidase family enzyme
VLFRTLARHPKLLRSFLAWGNRLLFSGLLPGRDRELLILRTAWNWQASFEWGHHTGIGEASGLSADEIRRIPLWPEVGGWSALEASLLDAADELWRHGKIPPDTWSVLAAHYRIEQLIEVPLVVGNYTMIAFFAQSVGLENDSGIDLPAIKQNDDHEGQQRTIR